MTWRTTPLLSTLHQCRSMFDSSSVNMWPLLSNLSNWRVLKCWLLTRCVLKSRKPSKILIPKTLPVQTTWILSVFGELLTFFLYRKVETPKLNNRHPPALNSPTAPTAVTNRFLGALARNKNHYTLFVDLLDPLTQTQLHGSYTSTCCATPAVEMPQAGVKNAFAEFWWCRIFFPAYWKISHSEHMFEIQFRSSAVILWIIQVSNFQQSYFFFIPDWFHTDNVGICRALILCIRHFYLSQPLWTQHDFISTCKALCGKLPAYLSPIPPISLEIGCLDEMGMLVDGAGYQKKRSLSPWHGCQLSDLLHFITYNSWSEWRTSPVLKQALIGGSLLCKHTYSGIYLNLLCLYWC